MKIVQSMARDENDSICEWISFHLALGFDHVVVYDDQSRIPISDTIRDGLSPGGRERVTIFRLDQDYYHKGEFSKALIFDEGLYDRARGNKQNYILSHFIREFKDRCSHCFFADVDEYLILHNCQSLDEFLNEFGTARSFHFPWSLHGCSFHLEPPLGYMTINFPRHSKYLARLGKSLVYMKDCASFPHDPHKGVCATDPVDFYLPDSVPYSLPGQVNHYQIQDVKSYLRRKLRQEVGYQQGRMRPASEILSFLCQYNDCFTLDLSMGARATDFFNTAYSYLNADSRPEIPTDRIDYYRELNDLICSRLHILVSSIQIDGRDSANDGNAVDYEWLKKGLSSSHVTLNLRYLPPEFDAATYRRLNKDLENLSLVEVTKHFVQSAARERRSWR